MFFLFFCSQPDAARHVGDFYPSCVPDVDPCLGLDCSLGNCCKCCLLHLDGSGEEKKEREREREREGEREGEREREKESGSRFGSRWLKLVWPTLICSRALDYETADPFDLSYTAGGLAFAHN